MVTLADNSGILSCTRFTETFTDNAPAGIMTEAGTGKRAWLLELINTSAGAALAALLLILKRTVLPSLADAGRAVIDKVGLSLSST